MTLSADAKKALQTLRKELDEGSSYLKWLLDELERHLGLKTEAPPAPAPAEVPEASATVAPTAQEQQEHAPEPKQRSRRNW